jgi:hypothetical protein
MYFSWYGGVQHTGHVFSVYFYSISNIKNRSQTDVICFLTTVIQNGKEKMSENATCYFVEKPCSSDCVELETYFLFRIFVIN